MGAWARITAGNATAAAPPASAPAAMKRRREGVRGSRGTLSFVIRVHLS
jgi:hypothetical protein